MSLNVSYINVPEGFIFSIKMGTEHSVLASINKYYTPKWFILSGNTIRFFTGNDCEVILQEKALINRISGKYKFYYSIFEMFRAKLLKLAAIAPQPFDIEKVNKFISIIADKNITLRPFTIYCLRYLFNENNLDDMIENINSLIEGT